MNSDGWGSNRLADNSKKWSPKFYKKIGRRGGEVESTSLVRRTGEICFCAPLRTIEVAHLLRPNKQTIAVYYNFYEKNKI